MNTSQATRHFFQRNCARICALVVIVCLLLGGPGGAAQAQSGLSLETVYTFPGAAFPNGLVYGPTGSLWLTLGKANTLGQLSLPSTLVETSAPNPASGMFDITIGPDGALWFTEQFGSRIGRLDLDGTLSEFPLDTAGRRPGQIVLGQDGGLWFTEYLGNRIGRLDPDGSISEILLPNAMSNPLGITLAANGDVWFTERSGRKIGKINAEGLLFEYPVPSATRHPSEITLGPDGALWFIYEIGQELVRVDPDTAQMTTYTLNTSSISFFDLTTGPDGRLWLLGTDSVSVLTLPISGVPQVESIKIAPVFESEGRSQIIAGPGAEMYFISANNQLVQKVGLPGANWRDLQVFIHAFPAVMLQGGAFEMDIELVNWSSSPAAGVTIEFPMPDNAHFLSAPAQVSCTEAGGKLNCTLADGLAGGERMTLPFFFQFDKMPADRVERQFEVRLSSAESDMQPANNRAYRSLTFQRSIEYFTDFSDGSDPHWSETTVTSPDGAMQYLGGFDNQNVTLTFANLPHHDRADLCFDLYVLGSWDGASLVDPDVSGAAPPVIGPDLWANYIDDVKLRVTTFSNQLRLPQSFPAEYNEGTFPAQSESVEVGEFDNDPAAQDSRYHLCVKRPHSQAELKYTFYGVNLDGLTGEKWALDNVSVKLFYRAAYDWMYLPLSIR